MYVSCFSLVSCYFSDRDITTLKSDLGQFILVDKVPLILISSVSVYFNDNFYRSHYKFYRALKAYCSRRSLYVFREDFSIYNIKF